jgi:hypothetical protein
MNSKHNIILGCYCILYYMFFCPVQIYEDFGHWTHNEKATYCKFFHEKSMAFPSALSLIGNCTHLNRNGRSVGIIGIRDITLSPLLTLVKIMTFSIFWPNWVIWSLVLLHSQGASRFCISITDTFSFNWSLYEGTLESSCEFNLPSSISVWHMWSGFLMAVFSFFTIW